MWCPSSSAIFANGEIADGCRNTALTPLSDFFPKTAKRKVLRDLGGLGGSALPA
jgi:hypothetical protein